MEKKIFVGLILTIFLITLIGAESFGQEIVLDIKKTCTGSNGSICSTSALCNITIKRPVDNVYVVQSGEMTNNDDGNFNYTLNETDTKGLGEYRWDMFCCDAGECGEGHGEFEITPSGRQLSTGESILYVIFIFLLFGLITMLFYFVIVMPKDNERNDRGEIIKILKLKYLRILFISFLYPLIILLLNLTNGLAVNFATLSIFAGIIGFLFEVMLRGVWVFTLMMVFWVLYNLIKDSNISKNIKKLGRFRLNG